MVKTEGETRRTDFISVQVLHDCPHICVLRVCFPLPLSPGEPCYSCQDTIELIRWIIRSPPWFCLRLFSGLSQGSLETCHVTFGCQRSVRRSKGAPVHIKWKCREPASSTCSARLRTMAAGPGSLTSRRRRGNRGSSPGGRNYTS